MPLIDVYNTKGEKKETLTLAKEIFAVKINRPLIAQAVRVYLNNQRQASAKAKTRAEVNLSGKKIYRQKGTGRARHGDKKAPIFVKGGKAHGPTGKQNYKLTLSKKMKKLALFSALTSKLKNKEIFIVDGLDKIEPKTKIMAKVIDNIKNKILKIKNKQTNLKITIILPGILENVIRSARNINDVNLLQVNLLNTYEVFNGGSLVFMKDSIDVLTKTFLKPKTKNKKSKTQT